MCAGEVEEEELRTRQTGKYINEAAGGRRRLGQAERPEAEGTTRSTLGGFGIKKKEEIL